MRKILAIVACLWLTPAYAQLVLPGAGGSGGGGGTPGGADTDVQFNSLSSFGGDSGFTYGSGLATLTINALAASPTPALILQNTTAALVGAQVQDSPQLQFAGTFWDTTAAASVASVWNVYAEGSTDAATDHGMTILRFIPSVAGTTKHGIFFCSGPGAQQAAGTFITGLDGGATTQNCDGNTGWAGIGPVGASNAFGFYSNGSEIGAVTVSSFTFSTASVLTWSSSSTPNSKGDTGISRDSSSGAGFFDFGNGTANDVTGTLQAAHATLNALANSATTSAVCYNTGTGVLTYDATVGTCTTSTARVKHDIVPLDNTAMLDGVLRMRPVSFEYNEEIRTPGMQLGLIAEDMAAIDPNLVALDAGGKPVAIKFLGPVVAYLIGAIKAQQAEIAELKQKVH